MSPVNQVRALSLRGRLRLLGVVADVLIALASYAVALVVYSSFHESRFALTTQAFDWGLIVALVAIIAAFLYTGLYKLEAWVARPLHVLTILKATLIALMLTAFLSFMFKAPLFTSSRLTVFSAFAAFFVLDAWVRVGLLDRIYRRDVSERAGVTVVIGFDAERSILVSRLKELRGYGRILALQPMDRRRNGFGAEQALLWAITSAEPAPRQLFIDGPSVGHKASFDLIAAAQARGAEVYIAGRLLNELDTTRLLLRLFEMPVMRVRRDPSLAPATRAGRVEGAFKRGFDVVASAAALVVLAPAFAVIAVLIKRGSPGPVFFRQERVGRGGETFEFLKFRTMTVGNDPARHREVTLEFIARGTGSVAGLECTDEYGRPIYKLADDERVTRVGRVLRKYSLDELPQFWNVLRGDMSIVGPRPALSYEVDAYKPWHRMRLSVTPGVSGLWQISGRSRVSFDEMVFQDVMYTYNQSPLTDVAICLRTVPAVLMGRGAE